jgi:hypothetical protein
MTRAWRLEAYDDRVHEWRPCSIVRQDARSRTPTSLVKFTDGFEYTVDTLNELRSTPLPTVSQE